jgi:octaprenyl-diphosphate synthase
LEVYLTSFQPSPSILSPHVIKRAYAMNFQQIEQLMKPDMDATNALIQQSLTSRVPLITEIGNHIVNSGGKRIRPLLVLLVSKALSCPHDHAIHLAASIEFIHTSTLLHDDVVDVSDLRRGKPTANVIWGNSAAVLGGDFLYSRTFELLVHIGNIEALSVLAKIYNQIAEGEMLQLINCHNPDLTHSDYMQVIENKTAKLFEASTVIPSILANASAEMRAAMTTYGNRLGLAFQMVDDMMDYVSTAAEMGKNAGDDLTEGKTTLPLIYAMANAPKADAELIRDAIKHGKVEQLERIKQIIDACGALEYTRSCAKKEADAARAAIQCLPESDYKKAMISLCDQATARKN